MKAWQSFLSLLALSHVPMIAGASPQFSPQVIGHSRIVIKAVNKEDIQYLCTVQFDWRHTDFGDTKIEHVNISFYVKPRWSGFAFDHQTANSMVEIASSPDISCSASAATASPASPGPQPLPPPQPTRDCIRYIGSHVIKYNNPFGSFGEEPTTSPTAGRLQGGQPQGGKTHGIDIIGFRFEFVDIGFTFKNICYQNLSVDATVTYKDSDIHAPSFAQSTLIFCIEGNSTFDLEVDDVKVESHSWQAKDGSATFDLSRKNVCGRKQ